MTDQKPRAARGTAAMTAETALKKIRALRATHEVRRAEAEQAVIDDDRKKTAAYFYRVPVVEQDDLHAMLGALGIDVPPQPTNAELEAEAADEDVDEPGAEAPDSTPRDVTDYKPGPAAQAATRGRR